MAKIDVTAAEAAFLTAIRALIQDYLAEEIDDDTEDLEEAPVVKKTSSKKTGGVATSKAVGKKYAFAELNSLGVVQLRKIAADLELGVIKKADILAKMEEGGYIISDEEDDTEDLDEEDDEIEEDEDEVDEEDEDDEEEGYSEEEQELREELEVLNSRALRDRARKNDSALKVAELKEKSDEDLVELIVSQEIEELDEEESDDSEDEEDDDEDAVTDEDIRDPKKYTFAGLLKLAKDNKITVPKVIVTKKDRTALEELLIEAGSEEDEDEEDDE